MNTLEQQCLRTDVAGMPLDWIGYRDAVRLYYLGQVLYAFGEVIYIVHGGINARSGRQSIIEVNSIVATHGHGEARYKIGHNYVPPLSNEALFARDAGICLYCGERPRWSDLSRDHITPLSAGGTDGWNNVITACKRCNNHKAGRTPEQAGMTLLAVPFVPNHAEYIFLRGRRILADQMEFLAAHFPRSSPLRKRLLNEKS